MAGIVSRILSSFPATLSRPPETRMIIFLGRRLPGASSDLPGSRNGSGRSVSDGRHETPRLTAVALSRPCRSAPLFGLAPDGVYRARPVTRPAGELLPRRFTLTAAAAPSDHGRGGLFSVALSLSEAAQRPRTVGVTHHRALWSPDFPPWHVPRRKPSGRFPGPWSSNRGATAIIAPATDLYYLLYDRSTMPTDSTRHPGHRNLH